MDCTVGLHRTEHTYWLALDVGGKCGQTMGVRFTCRHLVYKLMSNVRLSILYHSSFSMLFISIFMESVKYRLKTSRLSLMLS